MNQFMSSRPKPLNVVIFQEKHSFLRPEFEEASRSPIYSIAREALDH
jgi:hypothetical protein